MNKKVFISTIVATVLSTQSIIAKHVDADGYFNHYPQQTRYTCGIATARMWVHNIRGWAPSEGSMTRWRPWYIYNGVNASEFEKIMEHFTGKGFQYHNLVGKKKAEKLVYHELRHQHRPIAIAASTVHRDGSIRRGGHWLLIYKASVRSHKIRWVKLHDSLFGSAYQNNYNVVSHFRKVYKHELFHTRWLPIWGNVRQAVED